MPRNRRHSQLVGSKFRVDKRSFKRIATSSYFSRRRHSLGDKQDVLYMFFLGLCNSAFGQPCCMRFFLDLTLCTNQWCDLVRMHKRPIYILVVYQRPIICRREVTGLFLDHVIGCCMQVVATSSFSRARTTSDHINWTD